MSQFQRSDLTLSLSACEILAETKLQQVATRRLPFHHMTRLLGTAPSGAGSEEPLLNWTRPPKS
jgi:hypothetical protein